MHTAKALAATVGLTAYEVETEVTGVPATVTVTVLQAN
jgi:hypothetical protein